MTQQVIKNHQAGQDWKCDGKKQTFFQACPQSPQHPRTPVDIHHLTHKCLSVLSERLALITGRSPTMNWRLWHFFSVYFVVLSSARRPKDDEQLGLTQCTNRTRLILRRLKTLTHQIVVPTTWILPPSRKGKEHLIWQKKEQSVHSVWWRFNGKPVKDVKGSSKATKQNKDNLSHRNNSRPAVYPLSCLNPCFLQVNPPAPNPPHPPHKQAHPVLPALHWISVL